ncbi:MAG: sigma 54-interacting transcriptional regulator [Phycisphaerae bacterium]|nr:sigma 54-interacting transcriptional regulator [Phycisphaerae bacterium]
MSSGDMGRYFSNVHPPSVPIVGQSEGMLEAIEMLRVVARSGCDPVLILGQTGTGKELAARAVHAWQGPGADGESRRDACETQERRFVAVNCAALTANLLESEMFGHVRGAFTGADREKAGLFELAGSGTILLDEISEMPLELQAKFLRVLQERTFRKVGGTKDIKCCATIVASSNRDLLEEANAGKFRKDLYYRLAVFPVTLPALSSPQRSEDIVLLAEYFLRTSTLRPAEKITGFDPEAVAMLKSHDWPGNVRELCNVVARAIMLTHSGRIPACNLRLETVNTPPAARAGRKGDRSYVEVDRDDFSLQTAEREFILRALRQTGGQRTRAAALLGITRATLHSKLKRYEIDQPPTSPIPTERFAEPVGCC